MKKLPILFSLLLISIFSNGQSWLWAKACTSGKHGGADIIRMTADPSGNIFVIGGYEDSVSFGAQYLKTSNTWGNPFLAKYDNNGNFKWVVGANSDVNVSNFAFSLVTDNGSNTYVAGGFDDT
ncbi:MAG TPA: hypothetical protein VNZ45_01265, partial [Bacteroidia bacterium]|nr:hypothetical protein [Bacteroidia bacterium]